MDEEGYKVLVEHPGLKNCDESVTISVDQFEDNVCRFCLTVDVDNPQPHAILNENFQPTLLINLVRSVGINMQVTEGHRLPRKICEKCLETLTSFCKFKTHVTANQQIVKDIYKKLVVQQESQYSSDEQSEQEAKPTMDFYESTEDENPPIKFEQAVVKQEPTDWSDDDVQDDIMQNLITLADEKRKLKRKLDRRKREMLTEDTQKKKIIRKSPIQDEANPPHTLQEPESSADYSESESVKEATGSQERPLERLECPICENLFLQRIELVLHFIQHAVAVPGGEVGHHLAVPTALIAFCRLCGQLFSKEAELKEHVDTVHPDHVPRKYDCELCSTERTFETEMELMRHQVSEHSCNKRDVHCPICQEPFESLAPLFEHARTHLAKTFNCKYCRSMYITRVAYDLHLRQQHYVNPVECNECGFLAEKRDVLMKHIMIRHKDKAPEKMPQQVCHVCGKRFASRSGLFRHLSLHNSDNMKICSECGYMTICQSDMVKHQRIHTDERPYKCTFVKCDKAYKTHSALSEHKKRHLQIRKACNVCGATFSAHNSLVMHQRSHTGERPYECLVCGLCFARRKNLIGHLRGRHKLSEITEAHFKVNLRKRTGTV